MDVAVKVIKKSIEVIIQAIHPDNIETNGYTIELLKV